MDIMIPYGGLNGDIDQCLFSALNQTVLPSSIIVLVDSRNERPGPNESTVRLSRRMGVNLIIHYDQCSTSIIQMRCKLIHLSKSPVSLFLDSDILLKYDAIEKMSRRMNHNTLFVEGMRLEIGGRKDDFFGKEAKQVSENRAVPSEINCGDTALLLLKTEPFQKLLENGLGPLAMFNGHGVGGSDFAMTLWAMATHPNLKAYSAPDAIGWHLAKPEMGYWNNYAASDKMIQTGFVSAVSDIDAATGTRLNSLAQSVFNPD